MIVACRRARPAHRRAVRLPRATVGGWGAWEGSDGESALINNVNGAHEGHADRDAGDALPLRVTQYGIRPDSGGAGGGAAATASSASTSVECDEAYVSLWFERSRTPAWGLFGGGDATPPDVVINPGRADERHMLKATRPAAAGAAT